MPGPRTFTFNDDEILVATEKGHRELNASGTALSVAELQVLVLVDGFSSVGEIIPRAPGMSRDEVLASISQLAKARLLTSAKEPDAMGSGFSTISVPVGFFSSLSFDSSPEAAGGASILTKKGYYVRIARFPPAARAPQEGWRPTVLVVDDDPDLQKLIRSYLKMEGFLKRAATNEAEILLELQKRPLPDLILLDVQMPDANGFEVLAKLRHHPVLKAVPVIMLTGETTREAVLKGLQGGADGYVTKPFDPEVLMTAMKTVLGLPAAKKTA